MFPTDLTHLQQKLIDLWEGDVGNGIYEEIGYMENGNYKETESMGQLYLWGNRD